MLLWKNMLRILLITATLWTGAFSVALADDKPLKIPSIELLSSVVGVHATAKELHQVLAAYDFSENPKREESWGSSFGVFFELDDKRIQVGIRPPSDATNMPTYPGKLPRGLIAGDSIPEIKRKLGEPLNTVHDPENYYEMRYDGMTIYTMDGKLYEIWLLPKNSIKAQTGSPVQPATRPESKSQGGQKSQPESERRSR